MFMMMITQRAAKSFPSLQAGWHQGGDFHFILHTMWNAKQCKKHTTMWKVQNNVKCETMRGIKYKRSPRPQKPAGVLLRAQPRRTLRARSSSQFRAVASCAVRDCVYDCAARNATHTANRSPHTVIDSWASRNFLQLCTSNVVFNLTKIVKRKRS